MEQIIKFIGGMDKVAHFGVGAAICAAISIVLILQDITLAPLSWGVMGYVVIACIVTLLIEAIKEFIVDADASWGDIAATAAGCAFIAAAVATGIWVNQLMISRLLDPAWL